MNVPLVRILSFAAVALCATFARAEQPPFQISVAPVAGKLAPADVPQEVLVRLSSRADTPVTGQLSLGTIGGLNSGKLSSATVALEPHGSVAVRMVLPRGGMFNSQFIDGTGKVLASDTYSEPSGSAGLLHVSPTTHLTPLTSWAVHIRGGGKNMTTVSVPPVDKASGDLVLPELSTSYDATLMVLVGSAQLAKVSERQFAVLREYVLAGGTLALVMQRPEDLRSERISILTGGPLRADPDGVNRILSAAPKSRLDSAAPAYPELQEDDEEAPLAAKKPMPIAELTDPLLSHDVSAYLGGSLRPSRDGAEGRYGLGRVVVLGYDPDAHASSTWMLSHLVDLLGESAELRATSLHTNSGSEDSLRKNIDPNQNFRWALGISTLLLVLYGMLFFPLVFGWANKQRKLFAPMTYTPIASVATFALIVFAGFIARGVGGSAQQFAYIELGGGMRIGHQVLYRGFYSSSAEGLSITAVTPGNAIQFAENDDLLRDVHTVMRKDGYAMEGFHGKPWSTAMIREDGPSPDIGTIDLVLEEGALVVHNRSSSDLEDVLVYEPAPPPKSSKRLYYFPTLARGARVHATDGRPCGTLSHGTSFALYSLTLDPGALARVAKAWAGFENTYAMVFWPEKTPVVIGSVKDMPAPKPDMGIRVRERKTVVRVVGLGATGGVP